MSEDTRDIAIRTETKVIQLRNDVVQLSADMKAMQLALAERKGAERVARWLIGLSSGTVAGAVGAVATKFGSALLGLPLPK